MSAEPKAVKTVPRHDFDTPALRVRRYWHRHPARAFALMRAMAVANNEPIISDWPRVVSQSRYTWHGPNGEPAIIHKPYKMIGCPMCGGDRYALGWHSDWDGSGTSPRGYWHAACSAAYDLMGKPGDHWRFFAERQNWKCSLSGDDLDPGGADIEIDHFVPLYQVFRDYHPDYSVLDLMIFWGPDNLRAVTKKAHKAKSKHEAGERAGKF